MALTLVGATANAANFANYPAGITSGDLIIMVGVSFSAVPKSPPAGFTKQLEGVGANGEAQCTIATRVAAGSLTGTVGGVSGGVGLALLVFRGADTTVPFDPTWLLRQTGYQQVHTWQPITTGDPCNILWIDAVVGNTTSAVTTGIQTVAKGTTCGVFVGRTVQTVEGTATPPVGVSFTPFLSGSTAALPIRPAGTPPPRPQVTITGPTRAPYGTRVAAAATATPKAAGATITGYAWTVTGPKAPPAVTGAATASSSYVPNAAGTPGETGTPASFTATCTVTDSNGRTGSAALTTAVRAARLTRLGGRPAPMAWRTRWGGTVR